VIKLPEVSFRRNFCAFLAVESRINMVSVSCCSYGKSPCFSSSLILGSFVVDESVLIFHVVEEAETLECAF
jgi:hypothetical protein